MISWLYFLTTCIVSSKFIYISSWVEMLFSLLYCYLSRLFELSEESRAYQLINGWKRNRWTIAKFEIYFFICNKIVLHDVLFCLFLKQYFNIFTFNQTFKVVIYINIHIYIDDDNTEMKVFLIYLSLIEWGGLADNAMFMNRTFRQWWSANINKTNIHLSPQLIQHKKDHYIWRWKSRSWLGQEQ